MRTGHIKPMYVTAITDIAQPLGPSVQESPRNTLELTYRKVAHSRCRLLEDGCSLQTVVRHWYVVNL